MQNQKRETERKRVQMPIPGRLHLSMHRLYLRVAAQLLGDLGANACSIVQQFGQVSASEVAVSRNAAWC